ncbi:MAG: signal recognition particle protein [Armatimonadetes bacterium]|nr:signal recognition particle protein [Armatimonadota bacterium]
MFESLSDKLQNVFKRLRGKGTLNEQDVAEALREVRLAFLEADVNFKVVKDFVARVRERAVGLELVESLSPAQHVIKIVHEELTALLGGTDAKLATASRPPTVVMLCGLQGSGKTTTIGKLGLQLHKQGRRPLLVAADIYRPAAIKQLQVIGEQVNLPVFTLGDKQDPVNIVKAAIGSAQTHGNDIILLDTAGRLHIDGEMMEELKRVKAAVSPQETLLVVDAMAGQDAVNVAQQFNELLDVTGFVVTKLDGDARGGAALSIKYVTGKPIKFVGISEKMDGLESFHPERMASRILGMGDILSLIEKAESAIDEKKAMELEKKIRQNQFDLQDYLDQLREMKKMGPLDQILGMIPGLGGMKKPEVDEKQMGRVEAIILSMTPQERQDPGIINGSRRRRIAYGSGTSVQDVNQLLNQFEQMRKLIRSLTGEGGKGGKKKRPPFPRMGLPGW